MTRSFEKAMKLAALSGLKMALGPAFLASSQRRPDAGGWVAAAVGEMVLDKVGLSWGRSRLPLLIPHTLSGIWVAKQSMEADGEYDPWVVPAAAVVAAGVSTVAPLVRSAAHRILGIPDAVLGVAEDYFAVQLGCEAVGMSLDDVKAAAEDSFEEMKERAMPALQSVGAGSM